MTTDSVGSVGSRAVRAFSNCAWVTNKNASVGRIETDDNNLIREQIRQIEPARTER